LSLLLIRYSNKVQDAKVSENIKVNCC